MKKFIIVALTVAIAGAALVYIHKPKTVLAPSTGNISTSTPEASGATPETAAEAKAAAWSTFTSYLAALKSHDLARVTALSYQLSDTCKDPAQRDACFKKMDAAYNVAKDFKADTFTQTLFDHKQIILFSDWHAVDSDVAFSESRAGIFFTRKADGTPQVLYFFQPEEVIFVLKAKTDTKEKLMAELAPRLKDTDQDGIEDVVETCSYPDAPKTCVKTDPNKKDTNGNGWWDSTETWFYKNSTTTSTK